MKPRISRYRLGWQCAALGLTGFGRTPQIAYAMWQWEQRSAAKVAAR